MKQLKIKLPMPNSREITITPGRIALAVCAAIPVIASIALTVREVGRPRGPEPLPLPMAPQRTVQSPSGSWCAEKLPSACVSASGEIYMPAGEIGTTLDALFSICEQMPGAPAACMGVLLEQGREIHTRAVSGRMSPDEALARMLEGTGLRAVGDIKNGVGFLPTEEQRRKEAGATTLSAE
jgi:hypothetical protein